MKTKYFLMASALTLLILGGGCIVDDPTDEDPVALGCDRSKSWGEQTKVEADALKATLFTFNSGPSKANCESFRKAYIEYLEALEKVNTCVLEEHESAFLNALEDGKAELANLDCNQDFGG